MELDTTYGNDETIESVIAGLTAGTSVTGTVINENGPAGGWPVVAYEGPEDELAIVNARYDGNEQYNG
jgi:hypothetical protein